MTNEEINHVIAEFCGYKFITFNRGWIACGDGETQVNIPDYCNDLNAMHEAEKTLSRGQNYHQLYGFGFYVNTLTQICYQQHILTATASQRAEAFVRTIDKWKE